MTYNELYHYGILGMKWGVRRYQNYDGSYTKKGLARYNKAKEAYDSANREKKKSAKDLLSKKTTYSEYKKVADKNKGAKKELKNAYKDLKRQWMADEGRRLYSSGKTITDNEKSLLYKGAAVSIGANLVGNYLYRRGYTKIGTIGAASVTAGAAITNAIIAHKTRSDNKKIRAYYAHRS